MTGVQGQSRLHDALSQNQQSDFPVSPADKMVTAVTAEPPLRLRHSTVAMTKTSTVSRVKGWKTPGSLTGIRFSDGQASPSFTGQRCVVICNILYRINVFWLLGT